MAQNSLQESHLQSLDSLFNAVFAPQLGGKQQSNHQIALTQQMQPQTGVMAQLSGLMGLGTPSYPSYGFKPRVKTGHVSWHG